MAGYSDMELKVVPNICGKSVLARWEHGGFFISMISRLVLGKPGRLPRSHDAGDRMMTEQSSAFAQRAGFMAHSASIIAPFDALVSLQRDEPQRPTNCGRRRAAPSGMPTNQTGLVNYFEHCSLGHSGRPIIGASFGAVMGRPWRCPDHCQ